LYGRILENFAETSVPPGAGTPPAPESIDRPLLDAVTPEEEPEETPFRCKTCGEGFKMPRLLRKHEVSKHPDKPVTPVAELERQMKRWCNLRAKKQQAAESQ